MELKRCNIEKTEDGVRICFGLHDKTADCQWEYFTRAESHLEAENRELRETLIELLEYARKEEWNRVRTGYACIIKAEQALANHKEK